MHTHINRSRKEQESRCVLSCPRKSGSWQIVCDQKWLHRSSLLQKPCFLGFAMYAMGTWQLSFSCLFGPGLTTGCSDGSLALGEFLHQQCSFWDIGKACSQYPMVLLGLPTTNHKREWEAGGTAWGEKDFQLQLQAVSISGTLSVRSSSVGLPSLNRLEISLDFVEFVFQKHMQIITAIFYVNTSRLEEFWCTCFGGQQAIVDLRSQLLVLFRGRNGN